MPGFGVDKLASNALNQRKIKYLCEFDVTGRRLLYAAFRSFPLLMVCPFSCSSASLEGSEDVKDVVNQEFLTWLMSTDLCRPR